MDESKKLNRRAPRIRELTDAPLLVSLAGPVAAGFTP